MDYDRPFDGAKLALFLGAELLVIRRDVGKPIPWPGFLDFPGGGRERGESPAACALRETREETGLVVAPADIFWRGYFDRPNRVWFFAARLSPRRIGEVRFGDEGQGWQMMPPARYLADEMAIPHFRDRLEMVLGAAGDGAVAAPHPGPLPRGGRGGDIGERDALIRAGVRDAGWGCGAVVVGARPSEG